MIVKFIPKDQLRHHWEFVKAGLEKVRAKGHNDWIVEDIYCECFEQRAMLWIGETDGQQVAFAVIQPFGQTLHVWAGWASQDFEEGLSHVIGIAKQGNCQRITFTSARKGWERTARKLGFNPLTWEMKL